MATITRDRSSFRLKNIGEIQKKRRRNNINLLKNKKKNIYILYRIEINRKYSIATNVANFQ